MTRIGLSLALSRASGDPYTPLKALPENPSVLLRRPWFFATVRAGEPARALHLCKKPSAAAEGFRDPDWIQTNDPKLRRFVLYSAELPGLKTNVIPM